MIPPRKAAPRKARNDSAPPVQSLDRGLAILRALAMHDGLTLTELAKAARLPPSTAHRLVATLADARFVTFDPETARWRIGVEAFTVGNAFLRSRRLAAMGRATMRALADESGETATLSIPDGLEMVYVAQAESHAPMRAFFRPGQRAPLYCSAAGKAVLAARPEAERARLIAALKPMALTPHTLVAKGGLAADVEATLLRGFGIDDEEHTQGMRCVAAAIRDETGAPVAAVSISGPSARITRDRIAGLGQRIAAAAAEISAEIGGFAQD